MTQMIYLLNRKRPTDTENRRVAEGERDGDGVGVWDQQIQIII